MNAGLARATAAPKAIVAVPKTGSEWNVDVIGDLEGIAALESDWGRLLAVESAPFQTHAWNLAWYRHFADECDEVIVFTVSRGGKVAAILPAYRAGGEIRLAGDGICDYQDMIVGNPETARAALILFLAWSRRFRPGCRLIFEKLSSRGRLWWALRALEPLAHGFFRFGRRYGPCPWIELPGSLDEYLASLPKKLRGDLRRGLNRLQRELPEARVDCPERGEIGEGQVRESADFHVRHFRKGGVSPLADERLTDLLAEVADSPEVGLRLSSLSAGVVTLAVDFGFARAGTYYGYLTGFDPAFARLAPGKCLLLNRIDRWRREDGIHIVDCLCGGEPYKVGLSQGQQYEVQTVKLVPTGLTGAIRCAGMWGGWLTRGICNRLLRLLGR